MKRRLTALFLALLLILSAASALAVDDLFQGYRSNKAKIQAFMDWFNSQSFTNSEYNAWADAFTKLTGVSSNLVYVTEKGTRYHANPNCSSLSKSYMPYMLTLDEALAGGYYPCTRCVK